MEQRRKTITSKDYPRPPFAFSPAVKFGSWVFASMQMATDYKNGIVGEARIPYRSTDTGPQIERCCNGSANCWKQQVLRYSTR